MLEDKIPEIVARLGPEVAAAVAAGAEFVVESAKARVPYDESKPAGEPHLRDAIHTEPGEDGVEVLAGDKDVFWGSFVEHGSAAGQGPRPFLVPALEENREKIIGLVAEAMRHAV